jgi:putative holliday junction resolvase
MYSYGDYNSNIFFYQLCYHFGMRYLGIDYGAKRVGLSLSDSEGHIAFPYKTIRNDMTLVDTLHNICGTEEVSAIVLGESRDISGVPNKIMGSIEEFKRNLEGELDLPIYFEQEFMTSMHAEMPKSKSIFSARQSKQKKVEKDDSRAATLILQRFLDRKNNN